MAFAGVDIEQKITEAGLEGQPASSGGSAGGDAGSGGGAPAVNDTGSGQSELDMLAGDEGGAGAADPTDPAAREAKAAAINEYLDFEANKTKKLKVGDQEFTLEELQKGHLRQQDYTRKTQELAQERKYADNLDADLEKIAGDPALLVEFKRIYPEKYHALADRAARYSSGKPAETNPGAGKDGAQKADPELLAKVKKLEDAESARAAEAREREIKSYEQEIDSTMKELAPKYPLANDDLVLVKAQQLLHHLRAKAGERGEDAAKIKLTKQHWERVYKLTHEQSEKAYQAHYNKQRQKQQGAHSQGRDVAAGGAAPGQAPAGMKLKDVKDHMIASLEAKR